MKKFVAALLALLLAAILCLSTQAEEVPDTMVVVNCREYVSLRVSPSTRADRAAKIPLGAKVYNCVFHNAEWIYCEYDGKCGFVLSEYLSGTGASANSGEEELQGDGSYIGLMEVVNCDSWVSLRGHPSTSAWRLAKVPLGAYVEDCRWYNDRFIYCTYQGVHGYILAKYLLEVEPVPEAEFEAWDGEMGDYKLWVARSWPEGGEQAEVSVYQEDELVWTRTLALPTATELDGICVFMAGTQADPRVIIYMDGEFQSIRCATGQTVWTLEEYLGAGNTWTVDDDGNIYIGDYYGPELIAVAMDGTLLWRSNSGGAVWLYELEIDAEGLVATYAMGVDDPEKTARACFDLNTGKVLWYEEETGFPSDN